jgi:hypothetical protein
MSDPRFLQQGFDKQLAHVVEECGEVISAAGKTQRWGPSSINPLLRDGDDHFRVANSQCPPQFADLEAAASRSTRETMHRRRQGADERLDRPRRARVEARGSRAKELRSLAQEGGGISVAPLPASVRLG